MAVRDGFRYDSNMVQFPLLATGLALSCLGDFAPALILFSMSAGIGLDGMARIFVNGILGG